jgi:hypothetical protein
MYKDWPPKWCKTLVRPHLRLVTRLLQSGHRTCNPSWSFSGAQTNTEGRRTSCNASCALMLLSPAAARCALMRATSLQAGFGMTQGLPPRTKRSEAISFWSFWMYVSVSSIGSSGSRKSTSVTCGCASGVADAPVAAWAPRSSIMDGPRWELNCTIGGLVFGVVFRTVLLIGTCACRPLVCSRTSLARGTPGLARSFCGGGARGDGKS